MTRQASLGSSKHRAICSKNCASRSAPHPLAQTDSKPNIDNMEAQLYDNTQCACLANLSLPDGNVLARGNICSLYSSIQIPYNSELVPSTTVAIGIKLNRDERFYTRVHIQHNMVNSTVLAGPFATTCHQQQQQPQPFGSAKIMEL